MVDCCGSGKSRRREQREWALNGSWSLDLGHKEFKKKLFFALWLEFSVYTDQMRLKKEVFIDY